MTERVLITGGTGFIGHALVERLSRREDTEVVAADLPAPVLPAGATEETRRIALLRRARVADTAPVAELDVRDGDEVAALVAGFEPTVVVHLAAVAAATDAARDEERARSVNVGGLVNVLRALSGRPTRLVFISSSYVYGDFETDTPDERHPLRPRGAYGATKFEGEQLVRTAGALDGLRSVIVRPSAAYGPFDSNRRVVQTLIENHRQGGVSTVRGADGVLDFTYVADLAAGLELAAFQPSAVGRTFNLTTGKGRSLRELVDILRRHLPGLRVEEAPADAERPRRGTLDIGHARMHLGFQPAWDLESGVKSYLEFYDTVVDEGTRRRVTA
ncbi:NAD(P)-dependent oxidoreductase [Streptomyces sp. NPDC046939]|uniref:NAD-dependent epimerase/dehydratase family protein n=1 Tax=Streptomyces sp. NPDC046939 TaxID=3155376 RepID=UPI0033BFD959